VVIAQRLGRYDTVGIDLVGMVVDDLVTCGAEPLFMTDYVVFGRLNPERAAAVVAGGAAGAWGPGGGPPAGRAGRASRAPRPRRLRRGRRGHRRGGGRADAGRAPGPGRGRGDRARLIGPARQRVLAGPAGARRDRAGPGRRAAGAGHLGGGG